MRLYTTPINIYPDRGMLVVRTPYDASFVADLKRLPASDRRFDPGRKVWLVTPDHAVEIEDLVRAHFFQTIHINAPVATSAPELRVLDIRYIGQAKDRGAGDRTAYGWMDNGWNAIFPERALRVWFEGEEDHYPGETLTLYGVLGIKLKSDDTEIKTAYRRMARQWHPDVCHEPNAAGMFRAVQHAYDVLKDTRLRARYDVGLKLAGETPVVASGKGDIFSARGFDDGYRSPLRCGLILADCLNKLGKFQVTQIQQWADITDARGRTLVTSWPMGNEVPDEEWA